MRKLASIVDRVFGRAPLEVVDGGVNCPIRGAQLDVEACTSCPYWHRHEIDERSRGVVICRLRTAVGGYASDTPPM